MQHVLVVLVASLSLAAATVALAVLYSRMIPAPSLARSLGLSVTVALVGCASWFLLVPLVAPSSVSALFVPIGMLAGLASLLATIVVRAAGASIPVTLIFAVLWSCGVFVPVALASFVTGMLGVISLDHGGAIATSVAGGASALGVLLAAGTSAPRLRVAALPKSLGVSAVVVFVLGWLGWLVGAELALDEVSGTILVNGVLGGIGGIVGWLAVQRIRHQVTSLAAVSAGLVGGLVAVSAGAPLLSPVAAVSTGMLAAAAACIFTLRRVGASRRQQWFIVGSHLVAASVGLVLVGLLATDSGFLFTGQVGIIQDQIVGTLMAALYSGAFSFVLWLVLARVPRRVPTPAEG